MAEKPELPARSTDDGDAFEKRVRFGCGFVFGLVSGGLFLVRVVAESLGVNAAGAVASALICGFLAMRFGERFWSWVRDWW